MLKCILAILLLLCSSVSSQIINRVYLVDSAGAVIQNPLLNGDIISLDEIPSNGFNIQADISPRPYKVTFQYDNLARKTEFGVPYVAFGDYRVKPATPGKHVIIIVPYVSIYTPANVGVRIAFDIVDHAPLLTGRVSADYPISLLGDTVFLSMSIYDTANRRFIDSVKTVRFLIDDYGPSIVMLSRPYHYPWKPAAAGLHVIYGEGTDYDGRKFRTPPETLLTVTPEMVKSAYFVKRGWNGHGIEAIVTGFGR